MKCENVQFIYQSDPREADAEVQAHLSECPTCRAVAESERVFDAALKQAVQLNASEALKTRLLDIPNQVEAIEVSAEPDTVVPLQAKSKSRSWTAWGAYAIAASLMLAIGLINLNPFHSNIGHSHGGGDVPVGQLIYEHLSYHGGPALAKHTVAAADIQRKMSDFGIRVDVPGQISTIERCPIGDTYGLHMVYRTESGPVTFIYMPDIEVSAPQGFNYDGMQGLIRPAPKGSMAIVGDGNFNLQQTEIELKKGIEWL